MAQNESKSTDLNVRIIEAVEYCPLLYKGHATIEERRAVWQQMSEQLCVSESVLKSRWHILCGYYQRSLEKQRSTDETENGQDGAARSYFRYEKEMAFMMPYMHARIAIAAANAARKQQELAAAGNKELTDPEFIITERDLEEATRISNNLSEEYIFYDVETLDGDVEQYQDHQQHHMDSNSNIEEDEENQEQQLVQNEHEEINEVIEEVDESGNIVVQDLIIEGGELISEDGEQIVVEEDDLFQIDDQIETVIEEVVEHTPSLEETHTELETTQEEIVTQTVVYQDNGSRRIIRVPANKNGHKFAKIVEEAEIETETSHSEHERTLREEQNEYKEQQQQQQHHQQQQQKVQSTPSFAQEYAIMTRRRRAVVLKATPRVQVELTDNAAAANTTNSVEIHEEIEDSALDVAAHAIVVDDNSDETTTNIQTTTTTNENSNSITRYNQQQQIRLHERYGGVNCHDSSSDHDNRSNDSNVVTTTAAEIEEYHTAKGERSEDTIFGELVTAMLKHMPQERKRAIKKSIMDILLT